LHTKKTKKPKQTNKQTHNERPKYLVPDSRETITRQKTPTINQIKALHTKQQQQQKTTHPQHSSTQNRLTRIAKKKKEELLKRVLTSF
jgi:hypothetical protein